MTLRALAFTLALSTFATAQSAKVNYFGLGCGPTPPFGTPRIEVLAPPRIGALVPIACNDLFARDLGGGCFWGGLAFLAFGASATKWGGLPLPVTLPGILTQQYPCFIWSSVDVLLPWTLTYGPTTTQITLPNDPALIGQRLYAQWICWYNSTIHCPLPFSYWMTSNAAEMVIGQ